MQLIVLLFVSILDQVRSTSPDLDFIREECKLVGSSTIRIYKGWPYEVKCERVRSSLYEKDYHFDDEAIAVCQIWNANGTLLNSFSRTYEDYYDEESHFVEDVNVNGSNDFVVVENLTTEDGNHCFYVELNLTLIEFKPESCKEFVKNFERERPIPTFLNGPYTFNCEPKSTTIPSFTHSSNFTYRFQRSCGETIKNDSSKLFFSSVQQSDAGDYVCSVIHNGMTRYVSMKSICVAEKLKLVKPAYNCETEELRLKLGENATFRCNVTVGRGDAQRSEVHVQWKKLQKEKEKSCKSFSKPSHEYEKTACVLGFRKKCSLNSNYISNANESQVNITFAIRNITQEDYGNYTLIIIAGPFNENFSLTLKPYVVDSLEAKIWKIVVAIIIVLVIIGLVGFLIHQRLYVKVYYKRHFAPFSEENKVYGALLIYHYSEDIDGFAQKHVKSSIAKIEAMLKSLDFTVCDERRDSNSGNNRAENITQLMEACHRVVILLTSELIKDDWSLFSLQKGFNEMVNARSKLIFILPPGVKEHLKQHSKTDHVYKVIVSALKVNHVIELPSNDDSRKFPLQLEYAMPKLKKETSGGFDKLKSQISTHTTLTELQDHDLYV